MSARVSVENFCATEMNFGSGLCRPPGSGMGIEDGSMVLSLCSGACGADYFLSLVNTAHQGAAIVEAAIEGIG